MNYETTSFLIIAFLIYSVCGWLWESLILPIVSRKPIHNSGFLTGPYVPIYGFGAIAVYLLFTPDEKFYSIFLEGAVVACIIEYFTSWAMEKLFNRRWWDYSYMKFNLNGRICLAGFLVFGLFSLISVKYTDPYIYTHVMDIELIPLIIIATMGFTIFGVDVFMTTIHALHLKEHFDELQHDFHQEAQRLQLQLNEHKLDREKIILLLQEHNQLPQNYIDKRLLKAFPHLLNKKDTH